MFQALEAAGAKLSLVRVGKRRAHLTNQKRATCGLKANVWGGSKRGNHGRRLGQTVDVVDYHE